MINENNQTIIPLKYDFLYDSDNIDFMKENLICAELDEKIGIINENNQTIIPLEYDSLKFLNSNLILAKNGDQYGVIDINNNIIIPFFEYEEIELKGDYIYVQNNMQGGIYDLQGKEIIPVEYDGLSEFSENGLISVIKNDKCGVLNKDNEIVIDFTYDLIWKFLKVD